jgi:hypothetical protein
MAIVAHPQGYGHHVVAAVHIPFLRIIRKLEEGPVAEAGSQLRVGDGADAIRPEGRRDYAPPPSTQPDADPSDRPPQCPAAARRGSPRRSGSRNSSAPLVISAPATRTSMLSRSFRMSARSVRCSGSSLQQTPSHSSRTRRGRRAVDRGPGGSEGDPGFGTGGEGVKGPALFNRRSERNDEVTHVSGGQEVRLFGVASDRFVLVVTDEVTADVV